MKITISGLPGSGKTTIAKMLSKELKCPFLSVGGLRREIAKEKGLTIQELNKIGEKENWTDELADQKQIELGKKNQNFVFEGRLSWHFIPNSIKILLETSNEEGGKRIMEEKRSSEKKTKSLDEQIKINLKRTESDIKRYKKIYGIENFLKKSNYNLIIDTSLLKPEEVLSIILGVIKNINYFKQTEPSFLNKMHNIFSNKKEEKALEKPKEVIEVDFREKNSLVPSFLIKKGFSVEFKELKVADYLLKGIAIERKTAKDFFSSLFDKRLFSQMSELSQYDKRLLIIEGDLEKENRIHENALKGIILSISLDYRIPIIFSKNEEETSQYLASIGNKKENPHPLNPKKKNLSKEEELLFILESFPGIGPSKAKKLLIEFGSIKSIANTSENKLKEVLGKNTKDFKEILLRKYSKTRN